MNTGMDILMALLFLSIAVPIGIYFIMAKNEKIEKSGKKANRFKNTLAINIGSFFAIMIIASAVLFSGNAFAADATTTATGGLVYLGAGLAVAGSTIGAGIAVAKGAAAAIGAISENESMMGRSLIFVALGEGVAIYGLVISIMILGKA